MAVTLIAFVSNNTCSVIVASSSIMKEMLTGNIDLNEDYKSKLKPIIDKCTMMDPKERYGSYEELIAVLEGRNFN